MTVKLGIDVFRLSLSVMCAAAMGSTNAFTAAAGATAGASTATAAALRFTLLLTDSLLSFGSAGMWK